ncbi:MAG: hypothetical protein SGBAC_011601 [Bacillariaceae sp.]
MTTLTAAPTNADVDPMMESNDIQMDDTSIQSFCNGEDNEDCEEIVDLLLNPFDEDDDAIGVVNVFGNDDDVEPKSDDVFMMMDDKLMTDVDGQELSSSLRQVSEGSKSTTVPDGMITSSNNNAMMSAQQQKLQISVGLTNRIPIQLYLSCNPDYLNDYQVEIRKLIQLFEATPAYVEGQRVKGRNRAIVLGQVGVQCAHCGQLFPPQNRAKGSTYFPQKLAGIYQACQILSATHLLDSCPNIPPPTRAKLQEMQKTSKASRTAGKDYWASTAEALGVYEDGHGLRFEKRIPTYDQLKARMRAKGDSKDDNYKY